MIVIVPTRGRPQSVIRLFEAWETTQATAELCFVVNANDEDLDEYRKILRDAPAYARWIVAPVTNMVEALNYAAVKYAKARFHTIIGFMGDDHLPRTQQWDTIIERTFIANGPAVVYCNDLLQGVNLPTQVFLPAALIRTAGHMAPRGLVHLYADNYWKSLGEASQLRYLEDVIIEHMHPVAGKAEWDNDYRRVNAGAVYQADSHAFTQFVAEGRLEQDVQTMTRLWMHWRDAGSSC